MDISLWRSFKFFDASVDNEAKDATFAATCYASSSGYLFAGCSDGTVRQLDESGELVRSFRAYEDGCAVTHLKFVENSPYLFTLGADEEPGAILKLWTLQYDQKRREEEPLTTYRVRGSVKPFPATVFAVYEEANQVAVGFADGAVVLVRGDLPRDRGAKQRIVYESRDPVTGLFFARKLNRRFLFIVTMTRVLSYPTDIRGSQAPTVLDAKGGTGLACSALTADRENLVVARTDTVHFYDRDGKGECFDITGRKQFVTTYGVYLVLQVAEGAYDERYALRESALDDLSTLYILDLRLRVCVFQRACTARIRDVLEAFNLVLVYFVDGDVWRLSLLNLEIRLREMMDKGAFALALHVARAERASAREISRISGAYADSLVLAGNYADAVALYVDAVGETSPTSVIRKYMEAQRIDELLQYLEALNARDLVSLHHRTLMVSCYIKTGQIAKLDVFLRDPELAVDLDAVVTLCRQARLFRQAAYLAARHSDFDTFLDVICYELRDFDSAMKCFSALKPMVLSDRIVEFGHLMMEERPDEFTRLVCAFYTGKYKPVLSNLELIRHSQPLVGTEEASINALPKVAIHSTDEDSGISTPIRYEVPEPRLALGLFVAHPQHLIRFLEETTAYYEDGKSPDNLKLVHTMLYEAYLRQAASVSDTAEAQALTERARQLILGSGDLQVSQVLQASFAAGYDDGVGLAMDAVGLEADVFRMHCARKDTHAVFETLHAHGDDFPELYMVALRYFAESGDVFAGYEEQFEQLLDDLQRQRNRFSPLQVMRILAATDTVHVGAVKKYINAIFEREQREINDAHILTESYQNDIAKHIAELDELTGSARVIQATRCTACGGNIDLPVVHFLCRHSYHQRCLDRVGPPVAPVVAANATDEAAPECPKCRSSFAAVHALRASKQSDPNRPERQRYFRDALAASDDKVSFVLSSLGNVWI